MKGLTWKKIMSLVLAVALVIGAMQFNAKTVSAGTTASVSDVTVVTNTDDPSNPTVTYSLKGENGDPSIQGTYTDIVLAIDLSGSMDGQAVKDAKAAAKAFVDSLVGKDAEGNDVLTKTYVQIAIVKYSSTAEAVVLGTTGFGWNTQNIYFSNDKNTLDRAIDGLKAGGGTNYDGGMEAAEAIFAGRNNAKAIVFMSDGEPTYANGTYTYDSNIGSKITLGSTWTKDATLDVYHGTATINGQKYTAIRKTENGNYVYYVDYTRIVDGNKVSDLYKCEKWYGTYYWYKANIVDNATSQIGFGSDVSGIVVKAAVDEAAKAKNNGITIYTVLFNSDSAAAQTALNAMSTSGEAQVTNDILAAFSSIAQTIAGDVAGTNGRIEATLSQYVKYNPAAPIDGIATQGTDPVVLTWTIGDMNGQHKSPAIPFQVDKQKVLDAYKAGVLTAENGKITVPITSSAVLKYTKGNQTVANPVLTSTTVQIDVNEFVTYTVNYHADGEIIKTYEDTVLDGAMITPVKYTMEELELTPGYYDDYTVSETEINVDNKVIDIYINHKVATVKFYEINDAGYTVDKYITEKEVLFGETITAVVDGKAIEAQSVSITPATAASEAAITYTWNWTGKWNGLVVADAKAMEVKAVYDNDTNTEEPCTIIFKNGDDVVETFKLRKGFNFDAPAATEKTPDERFIYTFANWKLENGEETLAAAAQDVEVTGDKTYVAVYTTEDVLYKVNFVDDTTAKLIDEFTVKYEELISADKLQAANDAAVAYADAKTKNEDNKTTVYTFTDWDKDETAAVVKDITFTAQFAETTKQYKVTFKYIEDIDNNNEITSQIVDANGEVTFIAPPTRENLKFVEYGYYTENQQYVAYDASQTGLKNILENKTVYLTYRDIQKGQFTFFQYEKEVEENVAIEPAVSFTEDDEKAAVDTQVNAITKPAKADLVVGNTTTTYTFAKWYTFITYADMFERTPVSDEVVVIELKEADREKFLAKAIAPNAGLEEVDGEWISYDEYMEKYFAVEEREFFPTYTSNTTTVTNGPTPTQKLELPPVITETPTEEPTPEPTQEPTPEPTEEPTPEPTQEPEIVVEEPETPEGDVDLGEVPETPEGAPEEEVEVEPIDTPQGDLPQTGVAPAPVFFGIGAACVAFGGMIVLKLRRKEEM